MESFKRTIRSGNHLLYFGATWCKNCNGVKAELAAITGTSVHIFDTDEDDEVTAVCGVAALPTIQIWQDGKPIDTFEGRDQCNVALIIQKYFTVVTVFTDEYVQEEAEF